MRVVFRPRGITLALTRTSCCQNPAASSTPTGRATGEMSPLRPTTPEDHPRTQKHRQEGRYPVGEEKHVKHSIFICLRPTHPTVTFIQLFIPSKTRCSFIYQCRKLSPRVYVETLHPVTRGRSNGYCTDHQANVQQSCWAQGSQC